MSQQVYEGTVTVIAHEENGELEVIKTLKQTVAKDGSAEEVLKGATDPALFVNTYNASGFTSVPFTKVLEGRNILEDEFTFYLKNEAGDILETRSSVEAVLGADKKAKNSFTFGGDTADSKLKYTTTDLLSGNTYADNTILYYTVEEDTEGAVLDEKTGASTGVPTSVANLKAFTIYGENEQGSTEVEISISIRKGECRAEGNFPKAFIGETVTFECSTQGSYIGTQKRTCKLGATDGEWEKVQGACVPIWLIVVGIILAVVIIIIIIFFIIRATRKTHSVGGVKGKKKNLAIKKESKVTKEVKV